MLTVSFAQRYTLQLRELWAVQLPNNGAYRLRQALSRKCLDCVLKQRKEQGIFNVVQKRITWKSKENEEKSVENEYESKESKDRQPVKRHSTDRSHQEGTQSSGGHSLLLLDFGVSPPDLPEEMSEMISEFQGSFTKYRLDLNYDNYTYKEVLSRLLPGDSLPVPTGYEVVGHIAHFNLLEQHWPHRFLIGQVCLDKCACIKTVVAKLGVVSNEFRTFDMEVIAGPSDTNVSVKEHGLQLHFDFQKAHRIQNIDAM
eukprot:Skav205882  [mRNA]  locus=scaffold766:338590:340321:+ [translate_table: standard]